LSGLTAADLRFNIAKLAPGLNGEPAAWQNYINRANGGALEGSQERSGAGFAFGTLVDRLDGSSDISYQPSVTHRVTVQQANAAYPKAAGIFDFVPAGGSVVRRDVVLTSTCNQCHSELTGHVTRVDTRLCVTCHNPGSWLPGAPSVSVDFKVMVHRIHNGANLPSVVAGTPYVVGGADYSKAVFPQDIRNCTKCHNSTLSAQGDNWKNQQSLAACGSCHDDVNFGASADPAKPRVHLGGVVTDNSTCVGCHGVGKVADVVVAHNFPDRLKAASAKFKYNIISVTPTTPGSTPVITFSVTDPTNGDRPYDIKTEAPFNVAAGGSLAIKAGWTATGVADIGNDGNGVAFGQPVSINLLNNALVVAGAAAGTFTVTAPGAIPAAQTGTLRVTMEGHPAGDLSVGGARLPVKSVFRDFAITGTATARRLVVDIAKCDVCHDVRSVHGNNRTDEPGVCVVCHNPNATDAGRRPTTAGVLTGGTDGKLEESIDFKTMIHGIHASQTAAGGKRETGLVIYGFGGSVNDFSTLRFPGKVNDCALCHSGSSYQITGIWQSPTANGILGTTISTAASTTDPSDNLRISPIAAVCSSCHDNSVVRAHMLSNGANLSATQATLNTTVLELCPICHGPGNIADVQVVHGVR
jgi:OmcA/MtrC family decaheme c-type cytochrome